MNFNELNQNNSFNNYFAKQNLNKKAILAQNAYKSERKLKLRWILAVSCLPLFGIYAAFGIAPQTITNNVTTSTVVENITLPINTETISSITQPVFWYKEYVRRDDTLNSILARLNIRNRDAIQFIRQHALSEETSAKLKTGHSFEASIDEEGNLITLEYQFDVNQFMLISVTPENTYIARNLVRQFEKRPILKSAVIKNSLFGSTDKANIPDDVAIQIVKIFESDIDFHEDLRRGDTFNVIYEGSYEDGALIKTGEILAVEFTNNHKTYRAIGYPDSNNIMQYYTPEGKSLHKSFLRSPLEFTRITSGFSLGRFHPVLQRMRAHKGVDMAAPIGTGIKAAGDATVDFVGVKGGYGNVIILKHDNGISTIYGHLSRFTRGLHRGEKIAQGQIIGFVGMSGLATGPHLHYEFLLNGEHRDPMTAALPKTQVITSTQKSKFDQLSHTLMMQLQLLGNTNIAALE